MGTLNAAVLTTYNDPAKWERFSRRVLADAHNPDTSQQLRTAFHMQVEPIAWVRENVDLKWLNPVRAGYGRMDAATNIGNTLFAIGLRDAGNFHPLKANVSIPSIWNAWKFDYVQFDASMVQPMARNIGQALGSARNNFVKNGMPTSGPEKWKTSLDIENIAMIEQTLHTLEAPAWPEDMLGRVDARLAERGRALFNDECGTCHGPTPIKGAGERQAMLAATVIPQSRIGTDPVRTENASAALFDTSKLSGVPGSPKMNMPESTQLVVNGAKNYILDQSDVTPEEELKLVGNRPGLINFQSHRYKATTLDGVWATAPCLHNGSVPNIYELLSPVEQRSKQFWVGMGDYDPVRMGLGPKKNDLGFLMDTAQLGNSNSGHEFRNESGPGVIGRLLSHEDRMAIIEYLKAMTTLTPATQPAKRLDW